jgi:membrane protease subunit HflC
MGKENSHMRSSAIGGIVALFVILIGINMVFFRVQEWQQVVITQFGKPKRVIKESGLYFKLPDPVQKIHTFNSWLLDYNSKPESIYTKDKKVLLLNNYARWRITKPLVFLQALRTQDEGLARLDDIIYSELRRELGQHDLSEVISSNREALMQLVTERSNKAAQVYGIEVLDVRIKRADLPKENEAAVYDRMRAERSREAKAYRSEGEEKALKIRAQTDLDAAQIMAEAYEKSQQFRGEGDAEALSIYAKAYKGAEKFYTFSRTLEAYEKSLNEKTVLVQPANSDFFKYLKGTK